MCSVAPIPKHTGLHSVHSPQTRVQKAPGVVLRPLTSFSPPPRGLHVLPVALTVSTTLHTRDSPHVACAVTPPDMGWGRGGGASLFGSRFP